MKFKLILITIVLTALSQMGCKKFLDVKSDKKLVVPQSLADIQGILDDGATMNLLTTPSYGESSADDFFLTTANLNALSALAKEVYLRQPVSYRYANDWGKSYRCIYNANLALDLLAEVPRTTANAQAWDNAKGSALFFRAYYLFLLLGEYGLAYDAATSTTDLGVVLRNSSDFNVPSKRSTVAECYQFILSDLQACAELLPLQPQHVYRPSRAAVYALLSRAHLYRREYDRALDYADRALAIKSSVMDYNADPDIVNLSAAVPFRPLNKEIIFYTEIAGGFALHSTTRANIDPALYASYHADDLRRTAFFLPDASGHRFKGNYSAIATVLFSGLAVDELLLARAESLAALDRSGEAMEVLNGFLRKRWRNTVSYPVLTATGKQDALNQIRMERRKSLLMRNLRWMDIKRQNKEGANITLTRTLAGQTYTLPPNSPFYALPLPADIIEETGMPQN